MGNTKPFNTLFLDRDGVINKHLEGDYVKSISEFTFVEGALQGITLLSSLFEHLIIVTNQRGVGKGIMSLNDLTDIHDNMLRTISLNHGRIDKIYVCTDINEDSPNRKPNTGMIRQALLDFPDIDLTQSFMVGDSLSDILMANRADIPAILIGEKLSREELSSVHLAGHYPDLLTFAVSIQ